MSSKLLFVVLIIFLPKDDAANAENNRFMDVVYSKKYVDKTNFIKFFHPQETPVYISAPRKFGKTHSLSMLKSFYEINVDEKGIPIPKDSSQNFKVFSKLATELKNKETIFEDHAFFNAHFASNPVLFLSFKTLNVQTMNDFLDSFKSMILELYKKHSYVLMSKKIEPHDEKMFRLYTNVTEKKTEECMITSGQTLTGILFRHFKKLCVVLIDDIDSPVLKILTSPLADEERIFRLLKEFLSALLTGNEAVKRTFLTGNTELARRYFKNIKYIPYTGDAAEFFGFTEKEVQRLVGDSNLSEVSRFYGGYRMKNDGKIYNPFSVLKFLEGRKKGVYWSATKLNLNSLFQKTGVRKLIDDALAGGGGIVEQSSDNMEKLEFSTIQNLLTSQADVKILEGYQRDFLGRFLWDLGYFTLFVKVDADYIELVVPNVEVRIILSEVLSKSWMHHYKIEVSAVETYVSALGQLINLNKKAKRTFKSSVNDLFSSVLPSSEFELASTLHFFLLYSTKRYEEFDITTINGRSNLLVSQRLKNGGHGIILGLRYKDCDGASPLKELQEAGYEDVFQEEEYCNLTRHTLIGVCLNKAKQFNFSFLSKTN